MPFTFQSQPSAPPGQTRVSLKLWNFPPTSTTIFPHFCGFNTLSNKCNREACVPDLLSELLAPLSGLRCFEWTPFALADLQSIPNLEAQFIPQTLGDLDYGFADSGPQRTSENAPPSPFGITSSLKQSDAVHAIKTTQRVMNAMRFHEYLEIKFKRKP